MSSISKSLKNLIPLALLLLALNPASNIICSSNFRNLQSQNSTILTSSTGSSNSPCENATLSESGAECFAASNANFQCCYGNLWGIQMCTPFAKNGTEAEVLKKVGYEDLTTVKAVANSKLTGNMEFRCSNNNPFSDAIKAKVSLCGNIQDSSNGNCAKLNDSDIQCCYIQTGLSAVNQFSSCIGFAANKVELPSYAIKTQINVFTLSCGATDDDVKQMEACAAIVPSTQEDCSKQTVGAVTCQYGLLSKTTKVCVGIKGDIKVMKDMKLMQNLQNVEIVDASQTTVTVGSNSAYLSYFGGIVFAFAMLMF